MFVELLVVELLVEVEERFDKECLDSLVHL
jgi:hypothetical protein